MFTPEIMDDPSLSEEDIQRTHRDLTRTHWWLGNTHAILRALTRDPLPVRRVLDVGCGRGDLLAEIRNRFGVDVIGVDLRPPGEEYAPVPILRADAVRDPLPKADIAVCVCLAHHLLESELVALIRNVGRSCRRLVLLDLVRHPLPLVLFHVFVAPFLSRINAVDGRISIRRAYTAAELRALVEAALDGSSAGYSQSVSPVFARQVIDICWY